MLPVMLTQGRPEAGKCQTVLEVTAKRWPVLVGSIRKSIRMPERPVSYSDQEPPSFWVRHSFPSWVEAQIVLLSDGAMAIAAMKVLFGSIDSTPLMAFQLAPESLVSKTRSSTASRREGLFLSSANAFCDR